MPQINPGSSKDLEIKRRQDMVQRLYLRKWTQQQIATKLKVSMKTVVRDLDAVRSERTKQLESDLEHKKPVQNEIMDYLLSLDEIVREAWISYHDKNTEMRTKVSFLRVVKDSYAERIKTMQTLGLIPEKPQEIIFENTPPELGDEQVENLNNDFNQFLKNKYQDPN